MTLLTVCRCAFLWVCVAVSGLLLTEIATLVATVSLPSHLTNEFVGEVDGAFIAVGTVRR